MAEKPAVVVMPYASSPSGVVIKWPNYLTTTSVWAFDADTVVVDDSENIIYV
jgi:hypothetical protein